MKRVGIAASKIAKGNLVLYHFYVVLIAFLFSLFIFVVAGATVVFALTIIAYISEEIMGNDVQKHWEHILSLCMVTLTVLVFVFNLCLISNNLKVSDKE